MKRISDIERTLIDYFNGFYQMKLKERFSANVHVCYTTLLGEFAAADFPDELTLSILTLKRLSGLKSIGATQEACNLLKNVGLIDFHPENGTTIYRLCTEHLAD